MYEEIASTAYLDVVYRPDSYLLVGRWLCSITEEQLREGYDTLRLAALEHRCPYWLIDARRRTDRRQNGPEWVVNSFLPRVQQEMGGPLHVAFLVLPSHLHEVESDPARFEKSLNPNDPFQYARFTDEGAAKAWLDQWHTRAEVLR